MMKESKKLDSTRVALAGKEKIILGLVENSLESFSLFVKEREKKNEAIQVRDQSKKMLDKLNKKRFGVGFSFGGGLVLVDDEVKIKPNISISVHYSVFRF